MPMKLPLPAVTNDQLRGPSRSSYDCKELDRIQGLRSLSPSPLAQSINKLSFLSTIHEKTGPNDDAGGVAARRWNWALKVLASACADITTGKCSSLSKAESLVLKPPRVCADWFVGAEVVSAACVPFLRVSLAAVAWTACNGQELTKSTSKEDVTLTEVMDEEDVLQECKAQNRKLVDFLVRPQCMEDLVTFITQEPCDDMEEKIKYKYPNISCELLTSDVGQVNDRLGEDESLLMKLYGFLQNEPPLNPLLASFFSKIVEFLRKREDFVDLMIKHIGTSAIMDLLLRMLTCIEPQQLRQDVLNWLNEEKVIQRLVDMVQVSQDEDRHSNASQSLCEIIRLSRDQMFQVQGCSEPDPLLATLEKQETVEQLLSNIFDKEKNESAIVSVIQILLTLFETRRPAFEGHLEICPPGMSHPSFSVNQSVLEAKNVMKTTWGVLDPPVGNTRLNVVRLVASLLQTNTHIINLELIDLNTVGVILLFQKCQLIQRILDAWASNEKEQAEGGRRRGYMGHLTRIANSIVHNSDKGPNSALIQQLISDTNKKNTVDLVNTHHIHSSSDDEVDFKDNGFHQDSSLQQAFSDYQMQQMTSNFIEQFGFNDEEFADQDDVVE
ncbi:hypothetical protein JZ751_008147 [Albula glossodonta]|uniref:Protein phosphatase 6, regulatory subunit 3 n=1 Tax=Albula glossodonta TaxID=121402 RepID=A0A8T2N9B6_9TELE|nr:hypothetical protein JZ751_008147 [Albula glossodonta]